MTTSTRLISLLGCVIALAACGDDDSTDPTTTTSTPTMDMGGPDSGSGDMGPMATLVEVNADITTDTTWTADNVYVLRAPVYVRDGATLTIEADTTVQGGAGPNALVVTQTGMIDARGTAEAPIVFTSSQAPGDRRPGDWGGLVLLGRAPINVPGGTNNIEGLDPGETKGTYGGDDAAHNCGTLQYVRVEWAGFVFGDDNELNGLTVGGCGSDTTLEHIQVHGGLDDGIEFFGGTANLKWAVVSRVGDDSLDTDQGYQGKIQFFVVIQDAAADEGWEADNLESDYLATPRSQPVLWNATFVSAGADGQKGVRLRRGTSATIGNSIFTNFTGDDCVDLNNVPTVELANDGTLDIVSSVFFGCGTDVDTGFDDSETAVELTADFTADNMFGTDPMVMSTSLTDPNFMPGADLGEGTAPPSDGFFDAAATYIGAVEMGGRELARRLDCFPGDSRGLSGCSSPSHLLATASFLPHPRSAPGLLAAGRFFFYDASTLHVRRPATHRRLRCGRDGRLGANHRLELGHEHVEGDPVVAAFGDDQVGPPLRRLDKLQVHGTNALVVLDADGVEISPSLLEVTANTAKCTYVGVRVDVEFDVHLLAKFWLREGQDSFHDENGLGLYSSCFEFPTVLGEIVNGHFYRLTPLQRFDMLDEKSCLQRTGVVEIKRTPLLVTEVRAVPVIAVVLDAIDRLDRHRSFDLSSDGRLPRPCAPCDPDHQRHAAASYIAVGGSARRAAPSGFQHQRFNTSVSTPAFQHQRFNTSAHALCRD